MALHKMRGLLVVLVALVGSLAGVGSASADPGDGVYCTAEFDEPGCFDELSAVIIQPNCSSKVTIVIWNSNGVTAPYTFGTATPPFEGDEFAQPGLTLYQLDPSQPTQLEVGYSYQNLVFAQKAVC